MHGGDSFAMHEFTKYKILVCYDGAPFSGWQIQPNSPSIQEHIEKALSTCTGTSPRVIGSGRTDSGVHALAQVAHFSLPKPIDKYRTLHSLNALLPPEIRILSLEKALPTFHAQISAKRKIYRYHLHLDPIECPFKRAKSTHIRGPFDRNLFTQAASAFVGTHDFRSFTNESTLKDPKKSSTRTIYRLDIFDEPGGIYVEVEGNGFLYKMVRNIVGTLLDIAQGKMSLGELEGIFQKKDRRAGGRCAPPHGLFLAKVIY